MSNVLAEEKRQQVLALGRLGWSLRRIERATGVRRETASGYLKTAGVVVRGRGRPGARPANPAISSEVSTDPSPAPAADRGTGDAAPASGDQPSRAPQASACEPYRELIVAALGRGRNAMAIWQDLVDDHGFAARYASVRRFVSSVQQQPAVEARVVITSAPGEEGQVDYGEGPMVRDADSGKYRRTRLFVLTLGYSRKAVRLLVQRSSAQVWAELHERAFRRLAAPSVSSCSTTSRRASSPRTSTTPRSIRSTAIGYLPIDRQAATLFFQLISRRYERGPMILTSNQSFGSWGDVFGDRVIASAILDRILHHATTISIRGDSYRLKDKLKSGVVKPTTAGGCTTGL